MSGPELLPMAKSSPARVPVITKTAYGNECTKRNVWKGGAEALLTKPIYFVALRNEIDGRLARA
jgi:CheY-like chemotaxis protein